MQRFTVPGHASAMVLGSVQCLCPSLRSQALHRHGAATHRMARAFAMTCDAVLCQRVIERDTGRLFGSITKFGCCCFVMLFLGLPSPYVGMLGITMAVLGPALRSFAIAALRAARLCHAPALPLISMDRPC